RRHSGPVCGVLAGPGTKVRPRRLRIFGRDQARPLPGRSCRGGQTMKTRVPALGAAFLLCVGAGTLGLSASASGASLASPSAVSKPKPSPSPPPPGSPGTFVKAYGALVSGALLNLSPLDVQATSDGGSIALAETQSSQGLGVDWLVKLSADGAAQWQEQVGCASPQGAPGGYADGVSGQQTSDGGGVAARGALASRAGTPSPPLRPR